MTVYELYMYNPMIDPKADIILHEDGRAGELFHGNFSGMPEKYAQAKVVDVTSREFYMDHFTTLEITVSVVMALDGLEAD